MSQQQKQYSVTLIGDNCVDEYQYGTVDRISPEAPIPVFCPTNVVFKNGMAGNVENNLRTLGVKVNFYYSEKATKIRMIDQRTKQHLLRVDYDFKCTPLRIQDIITAGSDAIVISDYNKGTITYELIETLRQTVTVPIFIDTKKTDLGKFDGCFVKINELEHSRLISEAKEMIVTYGGSHVTYNRQRFSVPTVPVFDVCGAGDTFLAALVYKYLNTKSIEQAIEFAIRAAAITVQHIGVYAPTLKEIE